MKQVLELALEAIEYVHDTGDTQTFDMCYAKPAITAIKEALAQPERDYERGFIDGMQKQMQSSVDKAVNRMAQPDQKPVAYINIEERKLEWAYKYMSWDTPTVVNLPKIPLYTTPPQRTWVGLTDDEICKLEGFYDFMTKEEFFDAIRKVEAKLKEKNHD